MIYSLETLVITGTVEADISALKTGSNIFKVTLKFGGALAWIKSVRVGDPEFQLTSSNFVTETEESNFVIHVGPPTVQAVWYRGRHLEAQRWEAS
jgi:hypothetical protein